MTKRTLSIEGMHCQGCVRRLTEVFRGTPGVSSAHVTLSPPEAHLQTTEEVALSSLQAAAASAGDYKVVEADPSVRSNAGTVAAASSTGSEKPPSLYPLILIVAYIAGTAALATYFRGTRDLHTFLNDFMAGFFLVFSFFKLLDLRGFADAYRSYDLLARAWAPWAFNYPFVELGLGVALLLRWQPMWTNAITLVVMLVGSVGVLRALLRKDAIHCACLGTALNLPMTTVTLVEDLGMAAMAAAMLLWPG